MVKNLRMTDKKYDITVAARTLSSVYGMNFWPPKPGLTDMISTRSRLCSVCSSQDSGVAGLNTKPALQPWSLIKAMVRST